MTAATDAPSTPATTSREASTATSGSRADTVTETAAGVDGASGTGSGDALAGTLAGAAQVLHQLAASTQASNAHTAALEAAQAALLSCCARELPHLPAPVMRHALAVADVVDQATGYRRR